jgi:hypothetical protein
MKREVNEVRPIKWPTSSVLDLQDSCDGLSGNRASKIDIQFTLLLNSYKKNQNVFQTADTNEGLRIEVGRSGTSELIFRLDNGFLFGIKSPKRYSLGTPHLVSVGLISDQLLTYSIDGQMQTQGMKLARRLICSKIIFGSGYDSTRTLNGSLKDISITIHSRVPLISHAVPIRLLLGLITGLSLEYFLTRPKNMVS